MSLIHINVIHFDMNIASMVILLRGLSIEEFSHPFFGCLLPPITKTLSHDYHVITYLVTVRTTVPWYQRGWHERTDQVCFTSNDDSAATISHG